MSKNFLCNERSNQSVSLQALCDGKLDCGRGEDELDCGYKHIPGFLSLAGALAVFNHSQANEGSDTLGPVLQPEPGQSDQAVVHSHVESGGAGP
ncbi:hypothetical protein ElyMa_005465400 [Elysia marginata]|uniref:Uncharacterized protein n=1 Tax=Elysia marginata TaxID=1093978 RepID=A0AAV4ERH4_9GAST|nr:hypothetical protein ElyMa_005465400 [Elysia marginata]